MAISPLRRGVPEATIAALSGTEATEVAHALGVDVFVRTPRGITELAEKVAAHLIESPANGRNRPAPG